MTPMKHVVVVGAGPAGLAAALAALRAGAWVSLIDSADQAGGQYHRRPLAEPRFRRLLGHPRCDWWPETAVWAIERAADRPLVHLVRGNRYVLEPDALVLAPGAHDRTLPFPGWDLPGVFTAGAAQALAKGDGVPAGERVIVAGSGPFLLPVAETLLAYGSRVLAVLEANPAATLARGWFPWRHTDKMAELGRYARALARHRVPYRTGRAVVEARGAGTRGDGRVEEVVTVRLRADWSVIPGTRRTHAVDAVCVTHGFSPQLELPIAAGCALADGFVAVDGDQATTVPGVYAAGEVTGIGGEPAARAEGLVAGWLAAGAARTSPIVRAALRHRDRGRAFARRLAAAHPIGPAWHGWLRDDTIICRCEETDYGTLRSAAAKTRSLQALKLETRAGLGPCQARTCGPAVAELTGAPAAAYANRPIAWPIRLGELASEEIPR